MANISRTADPIFNFFFLKCAEFNLESPILGQIFDISHNFSEKLEKLIFRPGNHEIDNTAKFWRDGKKNEFRIRTQRQKKLFRNKWFCFRTNKVNFVDLCIVCVTLHWYDYVCYCRFILWMNGIVLYLWYVFLIIGSLYGWIRLFQYLLDHYVSFYKFTLWMNWVVYVPFDYYVSHYKFA